MLLSVHIFILVLSKKMNLSANIYARLTNNEEEGTKKKGEKKK